MVPSMSSWDIRSRRSQRDKQTKEKKQPTLMVGFEVRSALVTVIFQYHYNFVF